MKKFKVWSIVTCILIVSLMGCSNSEKTQNGTNNKKTEQQSSNENKATETSSKVEKIYTVGEEAFILDDSGKQVYSIKINGVKTADNFEYKTNFPEINRQQIIEVDYTYKNIAKDDENKLEIHSQALQVLDSTGAIAENSDMFPKQKPQSISVGANCTVQAYYGLSHKSDKIKVNFSSASYAKNGTLVFEIPIK